MVVVVDEEGKTAVVTEMMELRMLMMFSQLVVVKTMISLRVAAHATAVRDHSPLLPRSLSHPSPIPFPVKSS